MKHDDLMDSYNGLMDYLLLQTGQGIQKSKYNKHVLDWLIKPEMTLHKDGTVWCIESCKVAIIVENGTTIYFNIDSLFWQDLTEVYTEDIVQEHFDAAIREYAQKKGMTWIEL